jgi:hypothetical protein
LIAARDPGEITMMLDNTHKFKVKVIGPLTYHLGCEFHDKDGTFIMVPTSTSQRYWIRLMQTKGIYFSIGNGDHPEIANIEVLDEEGIKKYQTMI